MTRLQRRPENITQIESGAFSDSVEAEMREQDTHWGFATETPYSWPEWMVILGREYGEALNEAGKLHWSDDFAPDDLTRLRFELVQIAAVAGQMIDVIDNAQGRGNRRLRLIARLNEAQP